MKPIVASLLIINSLAIICVPANADSIDLYSGVTSDGIYDSQIHMLTGPIDGPLTEDFSSPATFADAQNGPSAFIVSPNSAWADAASVSPAQWISSDPNGGNGGAYTSLYAINFNLPDFTFASFSITFAADQTLGTTADNGLYLNGTALSGSGGGNYADTLTYIDNDVSSLLNSGENTLYLYNVNYGGPAGVIFDATVNFTPASAPEPSTYALLGLGVLIGLMCFNRRSVTP